MRDGFRSRVGRYNTKPSTATLGTPEGDTGAERPMGRGHSSHTAPSFRRLSLWTTPSRRLLARPSHAQIETICGVRPFRWTASCCGFDQALGVLILEVDGAAVAEG